MEVQLLDRILDVVGPRREPFQLHPQEDGQRTTLDLLPGFRYKLPVVLAVGGFVEALPRVLWAQGLLIAPLNESLVVAVNVTDAVVRVNHGQDLTTPGW